MHHEFSVAAHNEALDILFMDDPSEAAIESLMELAHVGDELQLGRYRGDT